ncbi:restriction endonuclease [Patescibacteria group bacterium]|nr:MAG: restriction endonuclease [Patescibacteria group bacterium]
MNIWTEKSIALASQKNYLDLLYKVYPMSINLRRELSAGVTASITKLFEDRNSSELLKTLLKLEIFPIKDSYVAYLKADKTAIDRNPNTVERITGMLYEMGLDEILDKASSPKETNRQIGPLFKRWVNSGSLGVKVTNDHKELIEYEGNIVLDGSDAVMQSFAKEHLGYGHGKGLDFIGKFNNKYVIAEAKFLTAVGGHQNAQFNDAILTMKSDINTDKTVVKIAILDGIIFIKGNTKMYKSITQDFDDSEVIISSVLLRDYLFSI